ncbi:cbb3-type cytochrome oxidase assembly protein CcoS [Halobacteriovorax sp. GB3]|uniref:cbb3-type cytochrome oxidase assembly protein CcoS n=1 Tax=Halobacteriovorax sp. GB3 TaxID=2719615 RepID=UPI00235E5704|nr:cbb3-type cytochrome oxidase assembly protein CcoS [Halobacteriovorax sp. GB3]MDD0853396.1 cbb3-type cytochrome oxidase assembly protein CcoS [Halobacteriovorax sp. GB3]
MNIIYFLLPLALLLGAVFIGLFIWATKQGQYDDLETPAHRMLLDDEEFKVDVALNINPKKESL